MTTQQVIQALRTCSSDSTCSVCPYYGRNNCADKMMRDALRYMELTADHVVVHEKHEPQRGDRRLHAVLMLDKDGKVLQRFESISAAARACDRQATQISACCRNDRLTAAGYRWEYERGSENADNR